MKLAIAGTIMTEPKNCTDVGAALAPSSPNNGVQHLSWTSAKTSQMFVSNEKRAI